MRLVKPVQWRSTVHFCGWDRTCKSVSAGWMLYFNFLRKKDGSSVRIDLSPPEVRRRQKAWFESLGPAVKPRRNE